MKIFPSIDVKNGHCVRLNTNKFGQGGSFSFAPVEIAASYEEQQAHYIHIVDLDGAMVGHVANDEIIREIIQSVSIPVQVGGGVRSIQDIEHRLNLGADKVVLGTMAVSNPAFVREAVMNFGAGHLVVAIDVRDGMVTQDGWAHVSGYNAVEFGYKMKQFGIDTVIYTNVNKDGMMLSPNLEGVQQLSEYTGLNVIVAGGITTLKDLEKLQELQVYGAIIRDYMYGDTIDLATIIEMFECENTN